MPFTRPILLTRGTIAATALLRTLSASILALQSNVIAAYLSYGL
jgi:hypothetical protein